MLWCVSQLHHSYCAFPSVFSESWEERQTPGGDKSTYNCTSSKRLQSEGHNQDVLSSVKTNQRIQALAVPPGLSASSHAQLSVHPQYFTHVFVSSDQHQHGRTGKMDRKRRHGLNDRRRSQEQVQKHNTSGSYEVAGLRGGLHPDIHESPEVETRDFHDFGRVMTERTSSKKHKSKREWRGESRVRSRQEPQAKRLKWWKFKKCTRTDILNFGHRWISVFTDWLMFCTDIVKDRFMDVMFDISHLQIVN